MVMPSIDMEIDVRRQYNRRVLFCIRVKGAALLIGLWDLFVHLAVLCMLILMFRQPVKSTNDMALNNERYLQAHETPEMEPLSRQTSNIMMHNRESHSNNVLLNRILEKHNHTQQAMGLNTRNFYSHLDLMTVKWVASLNQQDKCLVFFVVFSATILIFAHIIGVLTNKPSYIVPYFLIKVFNVIVSILSMLGFYAYMSDTKAWLRLQSEFPFKNYLLELDSQTLQLVVFIFLLFVIVAKLYIAAIIWYCYGYVTALTLARNIGTVTTHIDDSHAIVGQMYSPPKYEEAIQSNYCHDDTSSPPPYTPLLQASH